MANLSERARELDAQRELRAGGERGRWHLQYLHLRGGQRHYGLATVATVQMRFKLRGEGSALPRSLSGGRHRSTEAALGLELARAGAERPLDAERRAHGASRPVLV
jgi:hypothetical protein